MPSPLRVRVTLISEKFIDDQVADEVANPLAYAPDLQRIAAFRLLAHAEIEFHLEDQARKCLSSLDKSSISANQSKQLLLLLAIAGHLHKDFDPVSFDEARKLSALKKEVVKLAMDYVANNNGIKRNSFLMLNLFSGNVMPVVDENLLSELDAFGSNRGDVAHNPVSRVNTILAPSDEKAAVNRLLDLLEAHEKNAMKMLRRRRLLRCRSGFI